MANVLKIKRGTGNPGASLAAYELGWDTSTDSLYIGNGTGSTLIVTAFSTYISVDASGNVTLTQDLQVNGDTTLGNAATDTSTLRGTVILSDVGYTTTVKGDLQVDSDATFSGIVNITGATTIVGLTSADGGIDVNGANFTVGTNGNIGTVGDLTVNGNTTLGNGSTDTFAARGILTLSDTGVMTTVRGTLNVDEAATFDTTVGVTGNTTLGGANTVTNTIRGTVDIGDATKVTTVKGTLNVDQAVTFDTTLGVTGNSTLGTGTSNVNTIYGTVNLSNPAIYTNVKGLLAVDQATELASTLEVDSDATFHGTMDIVGDVEIGTLGSAKVTIDASTGDIATAGDLLVGGGLTVQGTLTYINSEVVTIEDPVMQIGSSTTNDGNDRGIEFKYNNGSAKTGFFGFDATNSRFNFIPNVTSADSDGPYTGRLGDFAVGQVFQPQTLDVYDSAGSIVNASANWNKTYKIMKDGVENALTNEILQFNGTAFIATTSPSGLTIDCGAY